MPSKIGRPKLENPKEIDIKVRIDRSTNKQLLKYCEKHSLTKASAIRKSIQMLLDTLN